MNRTRRFISGVASGYVSILCNIAYTAASIPLALHYLSKEEFGLWALAQQIAGYLLMLDLGVSFSLNRLIADQKQEVESAAYQDLLKNGALAFASLGLIMLALGGGFALLAPGLFSIGGSLGEHFSNTLLILTAVNSISFSTRIFAAPLWAFQRMDVANLLSSLSLVVNFAVLWLCLKMNFGVYSLALSGALPCFIIPLLTYLFCKKNNFYPLYLFGGSFRFCYLKRLFGFSKDIFELSVGSHVLQASQIIILSRLCGLETAALFAVGTKLYAMITQLVYKIIESSAPGLTEIFISGNISLFRSRLEQLVSLTLFSGFVGALCFFSFNNQFVEIWTRQAFSWPQRNDIFLSFTILFTSFSRWLIGYFGILADYRSVRHLYFVEALAFVVTAVFLVPLFQIKGVLFASAACHAFITIPLSFASFRKATGLTQSFRSFAISIILLSFYVFIQSCDYFNFLGIYEHFSLSCFLFLITLSFGYFFILPKEFIQRLSSKIFSAN